MGSWLWQTCQEGKCQICHGAKESLKHCLWGCTRAQEVWRWALEILTRAALELGMITWGAFCWCSTLPGYHQFFKAGPQDPVYFITQGTWGPLEGIPQHMVELDAGSQERQPAWEIIGSIIGWHIWTSRYAQILSGTTPSIALIMADMWSEIIHTLRGQWDQIQGDSRAG